MRKVLAIALLLIGVGLFAQDATQAETQEQPQAQTQTQTQATEDVRARFQNVEVFRDTEESQIQVDDLKPGQSAMKERQESKTTAGAKRIYLERFQTSNKLLY